MNIVAYKLVKRKTDDGLMEVEDFVEIGRVYRVDLDDFTNHFYKHNSGVTHTKLMVWDVDMKAYFPAELLGIEEEPSVKN